MSPGRPRILVVGPPGVEAARAYGGGTGGYTRNMSVYLETLGGADVELVAFHHSVRGQARGLAGLGPARMLGDTAGFLRAVMTARPDAVHVLAQYRGALPREWGQALICRALRIPFGYDVKAGAFAASYAGGGRVYRWMLGRVVGAASVVFAEGRATQAVLREAFGREAVYFPNFVPAEEVPETVPARLAGDAIRLLFVGFATRDKGVVELVEGAREAAQAGVVLELDVIGAESPEIAAWLDGLAAVDGLVLRRHGKRPHEAVLAAMREADIYVYPTRHPGEGHNNSINEAMMHGLVIVTTRAGFLGEVLADGAAYFLDKVTPGEIAAALGRIAGDRDGARRVARAARARLREDFTDTAARARFRAAYAGVLPPGADDMTEAK